MGAPVPQEKTLGGTQLPLWYECVALRAENKGLESFCEILALNYAPGAAAPGTAAPGAAAPAA